MSIALVAKYATRPILFAIAAKATEPYLVGNGSDAETHFGRAALSSSLPRPRLNRTAFMHSVEAVFVFAPNFSADLSTANPSACG